MDTARFISTLFSAGRGRYFSDAAGKRDSRPSPNRSAHRSRRLCRIEPLEQRELLADTSLPFADAFDFNGDRTSDVLWYDQTIGKLSDWTIRNGAFKGEKDIAELGDQGWKLAGGGDFNGDGTSDILLHNQTSGIVSAAIVRNGTIGSWAQMFTVDPNAWKIVDTGDFNGDGTTDILWQGQTDGTVGAWIMRDGSVVAWAQCSPSIGVRGKSSIPAISTAMERPISFGEAKPTEPSAPGL